MNLTITPRFAGKPRLYQHITGYARDSLSGASDHGGVLECVQRTAANNSRAIGRLLALLVEKGVIGLDDVPQVPGTLDKLEVAP